MMSTVLAPITREPDVNLLFGRKGIKPALVERAVEFSVLTEETGGNLWLPGSAEEMVPGVMS